jgi:hypothetical protein
MGVDLNPGITPGLGGVNGAQPVDPTKEVADPSQARPGVDAGASETVPGVWSQLQQWIATAGLQGTAAVDSPEIAAQQQSAQLEANQTTELQSGLASQSLGNAGRAPSTRDEQGTAVEPLRDHNLAARTQVGAAELSLPAAATAAAAQAATMAQDAMPTQLLQPSVLSSLVSGQPQPMWPLGESVDEPRLRRRTRRDREPSSGRHDDALFDDEVPEQRVRERDARDAQAARAPSQAHPGDDWCAALARRLSRIRAAQAPHPTHAPPAAHDARDTAPAAASAAALALARDQWSQGRAVLIVCPQRVPMDDSGWACLVWDDAARADDSARREGPRGTRAPAPARAGVDAHANPHTNPHAQPMLGLRGQRFIARLHWKSDAFDDATASNVRWWAVRAAKQHGVALGRQLRTMSEDAAARADTGAPTGDADPAAGRAPRHDGLHTRGLAVQLGPVLLPQARDWCVRVRIDAVQRLWAALEGQWSLLVVACDEPLLPG